MAIDFAGTNGNIVGRFGPESVRLDADDAWKGSMRPDAVEHLFAMMGLPEETDTERGELRLGLFCHYLARGLALFENPEDHDEATNLALGTRFSLDPVTVNGLRGRLLLLADVVEILAKRGATHVKWS